MTGRDDFDRAISVYLEARSTNRAPDGLLEASLARVETTRQRPSWLVPDRWLPADRSGVARIRTVALLALTLALLIASAITIGLLVGSHRRLPSPFGIARPGLIAFDLGDDIFVANPDGTGRRQITSGRSVGGPTFSPDGTLIAYLASAADMSTSLSVMGADGGRPTTIADHLAEVGDIVWSPDSRRVAFGGHILGESGFHVFVAALDHPGAIRLGGPDLFGVEPSWSPDGRSIAFKHIDSVDANYYGDGALWLTNTDGSSPRPLAKVAAAATRCSTQRGRRTANGSRSWPTA